jgi:hypothetical protein
MDDAICRSLGCGVIAMPTQFPTPSQPTARRSVGLLMYIAHRSTEDRIFADLADTGYCDITIAQGRVAQHIGPYGTRLTELAEQAQVTKQTADSWSTSSNALVTSASPTRATAEPAWSNWTPTHER